MYIFIDCFICLSSIDSYLVKHILYSVLHLKLYVMFTQVGDKLKGCLVDDWVARNNVNEFADQLIQRYKLSEVGGELFFVGGATGVNRERMLAQQSERDAVLM